MSGIWVVSLAALERDGWLGLSVLEGADDFGAEWLGFELLILRQTVNIEVSLPARNGSSPRSGLDVLVLRLVVGWWRFPVELDVRPHFSNSYVVKFGPCDGLEDGSVALFVDVKWQLLLVAQEVVDVLGLF